MKRNKCIVAGTLLLLSVAVPIRASAADTPLTLLNKSMRSEDGTLAFELWNTGDQPITAWRLSLAYDDGTGRSRRSVLDQDFALAPAHREEAESAGAEAAIERPILPGELAAAAWHLELPGGDSEFSALSLRVVAVVFEDGSFAGDAEVSKSILSARAARLGELRRVVGLLRETRDSGKASGATKQTLAARARQLREESQDFRFPDGRRREVAAQLSAARLEAAELLESLARSIGGEAAGGEGGILDRTIEGLEEQIASAGGLEAEGRNSSAGGSGVQARAGVQR